MLLLSLSVFRKYIYLTVHISIYLNTSSYSSFTIIFLLESDTSHHYNLSSSSNIIHLPSYISLIHLTKYISHKIPLHISHISYKLHLSQIIHTYFSYILQTHLSPSLTKYPYLLHIYITNTTSHKASISFTISILLQRYRTLILKPFSWRAQTYLTKALLLEGTNLSYKSPSHGRQYYS